MSTESAIIKKDWNWCDDDIFGIALLVKGGITDSYGNAIDSHSFYAVGKHKITKHVAIIPTGRKLHHDMINDEMKRKGQFN